MLSGTLSAATDASFSSTLLPEPDQDTTGDLFFHPGLNQSSVNSSLSSTIVVPSNQTFLSGTLDVEPLWNVSSKNGTQLASQRQINGMGRIN